MPASHRKFGDLLEEGIKRVHITRKKPIGYILDEFGYELRPDNSSKGRYALGHWYYKKRIPASLDDVATLAKLIVTNSDVDRDWLKAFLESAGFADADTFCDQFFLSDSRETPNVDQPLPEPVTNFPNTTKTLPEPNQHRKRLMPIAVYMLAFLGVVAVAGFFVWKMVSNTSSPSGIQPTSISDTQSTASPRPASVVTETLKPPSLVIPVSRTATPDFANFDAKCPVVASVPVFEYTSPDSFREFLNHGGSFNALKSTFDALIQKKDPFKDGKMISSDLTADGVPEIVINANLNKGSIWQILGCDGGEYKALVDSNEDGAQYLRFIVDLNGNHLPEIIRYRQTQTENTSMFDFFVDEWNGHQIVNRFDNSRFESVGQHLPNDITDWQRAIANASITTRDTNGDALYEVVITGGLITPVPTCDTRFERQFTEIWTWSGKSLQLAERAYDLPLYRFQRSADGDLAFALNKLNDALTAYQDVLFDANLFRRDYYRPQFEYCKSLDPTMDPALVENEEAQLAAYARWRILLINALLHSEKAMQVVYQTLQDKFPEGKPGHSYAVIASEFWTNYETTQNIDDACVAANTAAKKQKLYPSHQAENMCFLP